jgi:hypothetical protein
MKQLPALPGADRRALIRAFVSLTMIELELRTRGLRWILARVQAETRSTRRMLPAEELHHARRYAHWIDVAARHHAFRPTCLRCSLVLHQWLRREGIPSELRIGLRKIEGDVAGHAWVVLHGEIVNDSPDWVGGFTPLVSSGPEFTSWPMLPATENKVYEPDPGHSIGVRP